MPESMDKVGRLCSILNISNIDEKIILKKLSDGQRQKIKILVFLLFDKDIIILDEVTNMIKISILFIEEIICIAGGLLIVGVLFDSFEYFLSCFLLYTAVVFQYFIVVGAISLIFKSLLISLGASIIYWISSIVIVSFDGICKYFALFDASNSLYNHVEKYFSQGISVPAAEFTVPVIGFGLLLIIALIIIFGTSKKWIKKGL